MSTAASRLILWSPRIFAIAVALFLSIFALDAFSHDAGLWRAGAEFILHLIPTFALFGLVFLAWKRPWLGALVFLTFAAVYAAGAREHLSWILAISVPMALTGGLYFVSWRYQHRPPTTPHQ